MIELRKDGDSSPKPLEIKSMFFLIVPLILTERVAFIPTPDGGDVHVITCSTFSSCVMARGKTVSVEAEPGLCHFPFSAEADSSSWTPGILNCLQHFFWGAGG